MTGYPQGGTPVRQRGCIYHEKENGLSKCIIISGDVDYDRLDEKTKLYFEENCKNYPSVKPPERRHRIHALPEKCTYYWVEEEPDGLSD